MVVLEFAPLCNNQQSCPAGITQGPNLYSCSSCIPVLRYSAWQFQSDVQYTWSSCVFLVWEKFAWTKSAWVKSLVTKEYEKMHEVRNYYIHKIFRQICQGFIKNLQEPGANDPVCIKNKHGLRLKVSYKNELSVSTRSLAIANVRKPLFNFLMRRWIIWNVGRKKLWAKIFTFSHCLYSCT